MLEDSYQKNDEKLKFAEQNREHVDDTKADEEIELILEIFGDQRQRDSVDLSPVR